VTRSRAKGYVRYLVRRVAADDCGMAFVSAWSEHRGTVKAAFARGLLAEVGPGLWTVTDAGWRAIGEEPPALDAPT
jgi:hypothetical protein